MLQTKRLVLRQWTEEDSLPFFKMCSNKDVMRHFPSVLTKSESDYTAQLIAARIESNGWGFWAVEIPEQEKFIGFVGLHKPKDNLPFSPCVEIGWRLAKEFWGCGYATEAANESLRYAFRELNLTEVVSFTTLANEPSQKVMRKIGLSNTGNNFMHPDIATTSPQCEHVLYKITESQWLKTKGFSKLC